MKTLLLSSVFIFLTLAEIARCDEPLERAATSVDYERQIRPIFLEKCLSCHGEETQESHLRLDRRSSILRGGDSGEPAIVAGKAEQSHLIHLVSGREAGKRMPPDEADRLSEEQIQLLRDWIDQGAEFPIADDQARERHDGSPADKDEGSSHWSFQPLAEIVPPENASQWGTNEVDQFIVQGLMERALKPNPPATRQELIRRIYLDMLGLPPTPEEIQSFVDDRSPGAAELLIEHVLASSSYGERWARYWLDLVRFAETNGFETNRERPNAWPYRDYVIRAFNEDKPYDQFVREQIAGDSLGVPEATAYLVAGPYDLVKSQDVNLTLMQRQNELDDIIGTTTTVFMGLTVGCARCHNHKFDPIRQSDYYALQAIFAGIQHGDRTMPLSESQQTELTQLDAQIVACMRQLKVFLKETGHMRPSVNALGNEEIFEPVQARFVRMTIQATNAAEPCIDELEVFSGTVNVALSAMGAKASCSSTLPGHAIHKLEHVNDGRFGNSRSWISNESGAGWVQIELPNTVSIQRIAWARDREGKFADRLATRYRIEVACEPDKWTEVASSLDRVPFAGGSASEPEYDFDQFSLEEAERGRQLLAERKQCEERRARLNASATVYAGKFQQPGPTHRLFRGEPLEKREIVAPNTVASLGRLAISESTSESDRRMALADWIASKQNPLTARVIVNRIWQYHFGKGLVTTPSDFGRAGVRPSHPELLDWLAGDLMKHGWSIKHIHRLILNSATYQQSSAPRHDAIQADAGTDWWWRFPPRRLDAEPIRDSILFVSGVLDSTMYGPGFSAFEVELENVRHYFPKKNYGPDDWRRMIYMTKVRLERESVFGVFDCPDAATSVPRRGRSTTPLQALNLFNSQFLLQQAEIFAQRLRAECGDDPTRQVTRAFWLCFGRAPDAIEGSESNKFVTTEGLAAFCRALFNSNEFVFLQ